MFLENSLHCHYTDTDHKMTTRSKIKEKKSVSFVDSKTARPRPFTDETLRSPAARSLFSMRCILELPNELVTLIMRYFNSRELMLLRCVGWFLCTVHALGPLKLPFYHPHLHHWFFSYQACLENWLPLQQYASLKNKKKV